MYTLWVQQDITDDDTLATFWLLFGYILVLDKNNGLSLSEPLQLYKGYDAI